MLSPLPRRSDWVSCMLIPPVVSAFPDRVVRSACASSFSRLARRSLALRPAHSRCHLFVTRITEGFNRFVTSTIAPVASGWSICRVGLAPTGKRHLFTAHTRSGHSFNRGEWPGLPRKRSDDLRDTRRNGCRCPRCEGIDLKGRRMFHCSSYPRSSSNNTSSLGSPPRPTIALIESVSRLHASSQSCNPGSNLAP